MTESDKERLERIKNRIDGKMTIGELYDAVNDDCVKIPRKDSEWLIEMAERVDEKEQVLNEVQDMLNSLVAKNVELIEEIEQLSFSFVS